MSKEIDLIKCIIYEIEKNLYSDFSGNLCISYTPDLKKLLLALNTPEVRYYFDNQDQQIADLQHKLKVSEIATKLACERVKYFEEMQDREMGFEDFFGYESNYDLQAIIEQYKEQAEKEVQGENND